MTINTSNGAATTIGATVAGLDALAFQISAVPEPATLALLGIALAGLGFSRRKRAAS